MSLVGRVASKISYIPMISAFTLNILMRHPEQDRIVINDAQKSVFYVKRGVLGVLDARTYEEFSRGHIGGAYILPHDTREDRLEKFLKMAVHGGHRVFVVYCNATHTRSNQLASRIMAAKEADKIRMADVEVYVLDGALKNWVTDNPLVNINLKTGEFRDRHQ